MKAPFFEDVCSEIFIICGPQEPFLSPLGGHLEAILGHIGALLGRHVGLSWAVLGPSKSDAKTRLRKPSFLEDVSGEIAIGRVRHFWSPRELTRSLRTR